MSNLPPMKTKYTEAQLNALRWFVLKICQNPDVVEEHRLREKTDDEFVLGLTMGVQTALAALNDTEGVFHDPLRLHNLLSAYQDTLL